MESTEKTTMGTHPSPKRPSGIPKPHLRGYFPGMAGQVTALHGWFYADQWDFDISFELQVGREQCEFLAGFQPERDGIWAAMIADCMAGSVAVDGSAADEAGARLRWFIVHPDSQGFGLGRMLLDRAIDFCLDCGHPSLYLWTFRGLEKARRLYLSRGFELAEEKPVEQWGRRIHEQKYVLDLSSHMGRDLSPIL